MEPLHTQTIVHALNCLSCNFCRAWSSPPYPLTSSPFCLLPWSPDSFSGAPTYQQNPDRPAPWHSIPVASPPACLSVQPLLAEGSSQPLFMQAAQQGPSSLLTILPLLLSLQSLTQSEAADSSLRCGITYCPSLPFPTGCPCQLAFRVRGGEGSQHQLAEVLMFNYKTLKHVTPTVK